jgi:hypothetical protein
MLLLRTFRQGINEADEARFLRGLVTRLTSTVTTKQVVHAKIAVQKFCAISLA